MGYCNCLTNSILPFFKKMLECYFYFMAKGIFNTYFVVIVFFNKAIFLKI